MATKRLAGRSAERVAQMAHATHEILFCLSEFAARVDETPAAAALAQSARRLAARFASLQASADAATEIDELVMRTLTRVYMQATMILVEVTQLVDLVATSEEATIEAADRLGRVGELVALAKNLLPWGR
jgi:hypothetical protein